MLKALIIGENEALKKVEILSLSQELAVSVHFSSNATRTQRVASIKNSKTLVILKPLVQFLPWRSRGAIAFFRQNYQ
ncbi:hypothetical protein [Nodularia sp. NIES-3585]|uniref:hypothetical protein n=1 Tax=Nodularia sp. NIES-3585 TaxID=1973477 RepID=UPI000B5CA0EB|nr:hypothetical protein [Nodularia sp. NIES-3585]GAX38990.1 hypothetical protein NIES3585_50420 [Nodularia sp. NIES-3585]